MPKSLRRMVLFVRAARDDWASEARAAARKYIGDTNVDLVWTTTAPITSLRLGRLFQRKLDVPWVAELHDSIWRSSVMVIGGAGPKGRLLRRRASLLARPLREADAVVHVTDQEAEADAGLISQPPRVVPSAFDELAWREIHARTSREAEDDNAITVLFAGNAFPGRVGYSIFFDAVGRYSASPRGIARPIRVIYMGPTFEGFGAEAERHGVTEQLINRGVVSLARSREAMRDADSLLLVTAPEGFAGWPGGKLFEYLAACRPILAVPGTDEFVADILQRTGHGVCAPDAEAVQAALERLASGSLIAPSWPSADLEEFTWLARSRQLADVFESCLTRRVEGEAVSNLRD